MTAQLPAEALKAAQQATCAPSPVAGLRPVVVTARVRAPGVGVTYVEKEIARGVFHCWGKEFEEFADGACETSVAIVELDNGDVETYCARQIRFLDRE